MQHCYVVYVHIEAFVVVHIHVFDVSNVRPLTLTDFTIHLYVTTNEIILI